MSVPTIADTIARILAAEGVTRAFGVPGGGSSLELAAAMSRREMKFVLTHTETAAAIMAGVTAELTGTPGVVWTGLGPGATSVVNGVACAQLDRNPLLVITDRFTEGVLDHVSHQRIDHGALLGPVTKARATAAPDTIESTLGDLLAAAKSPPAGAVHLDLSLATARTAKRTADPSGAIENAEVGRSPDSTGDLEDALQELAQLIESSRQPALVAGLEARSPAATRAVRDFVEAVGCPALTTYKASGVIPHGHPSHAGPFTGGRGEARALEECDLLILCGVDPVELIAAPWPHAMPVVEISPNGLRPHYVDLAATVRGDPAVVLPQVHPTTRRGWQSTRPSAQSDPPRDQTGRIGPLAIVDAVARAAPDSVRATVDAGAHMFACLEAWRARRPYDLLISNGLSTMGYALPAAIGAALVEDRPCVALTGDGGLAMCLAELATAARLESDITVVVFNDSALSLIEVKRQQRQLDGLPLTYPTIDFCRAATAMGCAAWRVDHAQELDDVLAAALSHPGPALVDVVTDPGGYRELIESVRGAP